MSWLNAPSTVYPVRIDPTISSVTRHGDTFVQDNDSSNESSDHYLRAGEFGGHAERSYLKFSGVDSLVGKDVTQATLSLYNYDSNTCIAATMHVYPLTSVVNLARVVWSDKPTFTTAAAYAGSASFAHGVGGCANASVSIDVTGMVHAWASGALDDQGMQLSGSETSGAQGWEFCSMDQDTTGSSSCTTTAREPTLSVTYNTPPGAVEARQVQPCSSACLWPVVTNTTTPTVSAVPEDADGGAVSTEFQVWAGTSDNPTTMVAAHTVSGTSGHRASWKLPAGQLSNGGSYELRVRGFDGIDDGPWSSTWGVFSVDTTAPATPSVSSTDWPAGQWSAATTGTVSWSSGSGDVDHYQYQIDAGGWKSTAATSKQFTLSTDPPSHTVAVRAVDTAGNVSPASSYQFYLGNGGLTSPADEDSTQRNVTLAASGLGSYVTYQWRSDPAAQWTNIPYTELSDASGAHPTSWPQPASSTYTWNVADTANSKIDETIQAQACFSGADGSDPACQTTPTNVQLIKHDFGAAAATQQVGPVTLALLTGDASLDATDVNVPDYDGSLSLSRSFTTLDPVAATTSAAGVFGPGWTASLDGPGGDADLTPTPGALKGKITFNDSTGAAVASYTAASGADLVNGPVTYTDTDDTSDTSAVRYAWTKPSGAPADWAPSISLTEPDGTVTTWEQQGTQDPIWAPFSVSPPGTGGEHQAAYYYSSAGLPTLIVAPTPGGVSCGTTPDTATTTPGCRSLSFQYTSVDDQQRLSEVDLVAADPATGTMATTAVAAYDYTSDGHLADAYDPRISPALKTAYTYDGGGRIATITPPGLAAWTLHYDSTGRLSQLTRPDPSGPDATTTIVYDVPLSDPDSGTGLPDLRPAATSGWGQDDDLPVAGAATAIFPASHVPAGTTVAAVADTDWPYAAITYLDVNGRDVDDADYVDDDWQISTSEYDSQDNDVWDLSAGNRAQLLDPATITDPYVASLTDVGEQADLLATVSTYSPDGSELLDQQGPMHQIALSDGTLVDARDDTVTSYDQGAPNNDLDANGLPYQLPTTVTTEAVTAAGATVQAQSTTTGYDPVHTGDASGWALGQATTSTDAGGLSTTTSYDTSGRVTSRQEPADSDSTGERTTIDAYYTASGSGACVNAAEAGLLCSTAPGADTADGAIPTTTYSYNRYDNPVTETQTYGPASAPVVRTTSTGYDAAQRQSSSAVSVSPASAGGTPVPAVSYSYDPATGLATGSSTSSGGTTTSLATGYDDLGQVTSYTDATGSVTHTSYDLDGRVASVDDGKGTTSYGYDPHSGLLISQDIGVTGSASVFTAGYDPDGVLSSLTYPNGLTATRSYDEAGELTDLDYAMGGTNWMDFGQDFTAQGQIADRSNPDSAQTFSYDGSGRLTQVQDSVPDPATDTVECTTRVYSFNNDSDRTALAAYPDGGTDPDTGDCTTATTPSTLSYSYDAADRLTADTAGSYAYDALGRTSTVPAGDAAGIGTHTGTTGDLTVAYYADDMVQSEAQGSETVSFTLDPDQNRIASSTDDTTTTIDHYAGEGDSPAWTGTGSDWTRYLTGPDGGLDATVDQDGTVTLQLADPAGDIVATTADDASTPTAYSESTEYGAPRDPASAVTGYGWLGAHQRSSNDLAGLVLMGVRLYNPATGRFLSTDPVPGGNPNTYTYPTDPINGYDLNGQCGLWGHNTCWSHVKHVVKKHWKAIAITAAFVAINFVPVVGEAVDAEEAASFGEWAFQSRLLGAGSKLFGNATANGGRAGLLNRAGRGAWRLGWSVTKDRTGWSFRAKIAGRYLDFFKGPRF